MTINNMRSAQLAEIKALRTDARKLRVIARHMSDRAKELSKQAKADEKAERASANFYSKKATVDSELSLVPDMGMK